MNDLISRQAAIEAVYQALRKPSNSELFMRISNVIKELPPAQQERTGRWSQVSGQATLCSCCGRASNAKQARNWSYCPYCGGMMK